VDYRLACQLGGTDDDNLIIRNLPLFLSDTARAWLEHLPPGQISNWDDLVQAFAGNFQGTYVRPGNSWDLRSCRQQPGESLRDYIRRFSKQRTELPNVTDSDIISAFLAGTTCRDPKMEAYCDEVRRLEDKFYRLEVNHVARRYNEAADELAKIASARTTVPPNVFSRDLHQPSVKTNDMPEPEKASARPEAPLAPPEAPSATEGEALRIEEERNGVTPNRNWQTPYLQYLHRGELPLDRAEARRLARRAKSFVLLGDGKELYHRSPSGILQRCISIAEGQELL
jgi:hypothetical protein